MADHVKQMEYIKSLVFDKFRDNYQDLMSVDSNSISCFLNKNYRNSDSPRLVERVVEVFNGWDSSLIGKYKPGDVTLEPVMGELYIGLLTMLQSCVDKFGELESLDRALKEAKLKKDKSDDDSKPFRIVMPGED